MDVYKLWTCDDNSESQLSSTSSEIEKEIDVLRKTFDFVRLLKADGPHGVSGCVENPCQCFSFWKVDEPCENCISLKTFIDKKPRTKLEFMGTDIYQVFSKYVQVDGEPYVMELIKKLDEDSLLGVQDREKIMNKLSKYHKAMYTDALTGASNRRYFEDKLKKSHVPAGVAMIDLDDFKVYNDTCGHDAGDMVLVTVVDAIRRCIRKSDVLVLLDIIMPEMDGFEVLDYMAEHHWIDDIPVIMISSEDSASSIRKAYEFGVSDYISRPFDSRVVYQRVFNTIKLYAKQRRLISLVSDQMYEKDKNNRMMISILSQIVEFRNGESGSHVVNIKRITELLLDRLPMRTNKYTVSGTEQLLIPMAAALHDIGKIGIDDKILNKPGRLTKEEFEIMKTHSAIGANMLESLEQFRDEPLLKIAHDICRWHHERYDSRGYPDGLKGDEIPISAQIVSVADVYDALVSERVYKKAYSHEKAMALILNGECGTFNPVLVECLKDIQNELAKGVE